MWVYVTLCHAFMPSLIRLLYTMVYAGFMSCAHRLALCQYDASGGSTMHIRIRINKAACRHELPKCANVIIAILGAAGGLPPSRSPPAARPWAEEGGQRRQDPEPLAALPRPEFHRFPGDAFQGPRSPLGFMWAYVCTLYWLMMAHLRQPAA